MANLAESACAMRVDIGGTSRRPQTTFAQGSHAQHECEATRDLLA